MKVYLKWIVSIVTPLAVGYLSSYFTASSVNTWFTTIDKPSFNPPNWVFAPVWTTLYILMGIALAIVWTNKEKSIENKRKGIFLFAIQLIFNFSWSLVFFGQQEIGWALFNIIILWFLILITIFAFAKVSRLAAWLLVPYISWVSFATLLNYSIWVLN